MPAATEESAGIAAARRFVTLVTKGDPPSLPQLIRALDELAVSVHETPEGEPVSEDREPPDTDGEALYQALGERFPALGFYPVADPVDEFPQEAALGDGVDDLADIVRDLQEVLWRHEAVGAAEAHWYFHLLFRAHWGRHLRELSLYLHALAH